MSAKLRIGGVPYGVGAPLLEGLDRDPELEFFRVKPALLAQGLRDHSYDAALVSSIEGFRHEGYRAVDGLCIASRGPARSVRCFRRPGPIRTVGVDDGSATSVALLKVLLANGRLGDHDEPRFEAVSPTSRPDDLPHDLVMMIGDCGLAATTTEREVADLGELWFAWTGLPFVYALWLVRPGVDIGPLADKLRRAREAASRAGVHDGTDGAIYYDLGPDEHAGLARFHREAAALDLADPAIDPTFENPTT